MPVIFFIKFIMILARSFQNCLSLQTRWLLNCGQLINPYDCFMQLCMNVFTLYFCEIILRY